MSRIEKVMATQLAHGADQVRPYKAVRGNFDLMLSVTTE